MTLPLNTKHNNYHKNPKNSTVYTPAKISQFLYKIVTDNGKRFYGNILDPAIGHGSLTKPYQDRSYIMGVDIDPESESYCSYFRHSKYEDIMVWEDRIPDLMVCNPPFNGAPAGKLYNEVFLRHTVQLFAYPDGTMPFPIVMVCPSGLRFNQRKRSQRWRWLRDNLPISSIVSLPMNAFDGPLFHIEIVLFGFKPGEVKPHYFLEDWVVEE